MNKSWVVSFSSYVESSEWQCEPDPTGARDRDKSHKTETYGCLVIEIQRVWEHTSEPVFRFGLLYEIVSYFLLHRLPILVGDSLKWFTETGPESRWCRMRITLRFVLPDSTDPGPVTLLPVTLFLVLLRLPRNKTRSLGLGRDIGGGQDPQWPSFLVLSLTFPRRDGDDSWGGVEILSKNIRYFTPNTVGGHTGQLDKHFHLIPFTHTFVKFVHFVI